MLFCNSGAEANEAAFKMARRTGRPKIIAAENAFHGRTMGALALTGQQPKRTPFEPMTPGVTHVPYGDVAALDAAVDTDTAAVFLEPILGEAGAVNPPEGYLKAAREITAARGALLVLDEVQTGIGRTGSWFAFQQAGRRPRRRDARQGPRRRAADRRVHRPRRRPGTCSNRASTAPPSAATRSALRRRSPCCARSPTRACWSTSTWSARRSPPPSRSWATRWSARSAAPACCIGIGLTKPVSTAVAAAAREGGFLVNNAVPDRVRLVPPLVLTEEQAGEFLAALPKFLDAADG